MDADQRPRVTPSSLRRADTMCPRRLALEHTARKRRTNPASDARFAVSNRVLGDARLAHADADVVRGEAFVPPGDELEPEQRALYRAAAAGYLLAFGDRPGRAVDLGWSTPLPELGVDLVADVGLAIERADGGRELRALRLAARRRPDEVDTHVALLRTERWAPDGLRIVVHDVIDQCGDVHEPSLPGARDDARAWVARRVGVLRERAHPDRPRAGADCAGCAFVKGCSTHPEGRP